QNIIKKSCEAIQQDKNIQIITGLGHIPGVYKALSNKFRNTKVKVEYKIYSDEAVDLYLMVLEGITLGVVERSNDSKLEESIKYQIDFFNKYLKGTSSRSGCNCNSVGVEYDGFFPFWELLLSD
ncbi:MAG: hypothetical protein JXA66_01615, partial [Oligoflexia bacterium]|nr:hypothetical protein [Oligoflexia bacterium]